MKLNDLFENVPDIEIKSLMSDSRKKRPQSIFFCIRGMMFDGHKFIDEAIANGAVVIVYSDEIKMTHSDITYIRVRDVLSVFNKVADAFYDYPSHRMLMYGITGTNGKSTVASIIRDILDEFYPTGSIGTMSVEYGSVKLPPMMTTPDIDTLHGIMKDMIDAGMEACTLEVSSVGLEQRRVDSVDFDVAVFTNLTSDHLEYHGTMTNYIQAKKRLFDMLKPEAFAVINADDPYCRKVTENTKAHVITYGIDTPADYQVIAYQLQKDKTRFTLKTAEMEYELETNLVTKLNIYNLLAAIAALHTKGISISQMLPLIKDLSQIEGRMQRINDGQPFNIIIDFAHTPDGIDKVLQYAAAITPRGKRIITVTGSAGMKDSSRRPLIGKILNKYCDMIILTEDDPREEDPRKIANEIAKEIRNTNYVIIEDRYAAIRQAVELGEPNDTVVLLGKGDEKYIYREFGREPYEGDDAIVHEVLQKYYFTEDE